MPITEHSVLFLRLQSKILSSLPAFGRDWTFNLMYYCCFFSGIDFLWHLRKNITQWLYKGQEVVHRS